MSRLLAACLVALFTVLGGATAQETIDPLPTEDWRQEVQGLRIGVIDPAGSSGIRSQLERYRSFLQTRTRLQVELVPFTSFPAMIDAHATGRVDYALHTAMSFAATALRCGCVEPLAAPTGLEGTRGIHALIVARADGDIAELVDLVGARLAVTGSDSVTGYLAPFTSMEEAGLVPDTDLADVIETPDPDAAVAMVVAGQADAAVAWSTLSGDQAVGFTAGTLRRMVDAGRLSMDTIRIVWASPLIPHGPHAIRSDLPTPLKFLLTDSLTTLVREDLSILDAVDRTSLGGGGFAPIRLEDYDYVRSIAATLQ